MPPTTQNPITKFIDLGKTLLIGLVAVIGLIITALAGLSFISNQQGIVRQDPIADFLTAQVTTATQNQYTFTLEVADSTEEWSKGLMLRTNISENSGMIFIFPDSQYRNFWMKDTLVPLDIIYIDQNLKVVDIHHSTRPNQTAETYPSSVPAKYVIELPGGTAKKLNIQIGNSLTFSER